MAILERESISSPSRQPVPTNEFGIVIPPEISHCVGENCKYRGEEEECRLTRHHLHSTEPLYVLAGEEAQDFRNLEVLTVWINRCRHDEHHNDHQLEVTVPGLEVMKEATSEVRRVKRLSNNQSELLGVSRTLERADLHRNHIKGLLKTRERLLTGRQELLNGVMGLEVLPEELVTGALLFAAPELAELRLLNGSDFVLTGSMSRVQAKNVLSFAQAILNKRTPLQTGVDEVQLAA